VNKKVLALAVTSALFPLSSVNADTANVDISIRLYPQYQTSVTKNATPSGTAVSTMVDPSAAVVSGQTLKSRQELNSMNSKVTLRGDADVGGGVKGVWLVDQAVGLDTGNGQWSAQDAYAGISASFGTVWLGRFNTVYKELGEQFDFLGVKTSNFVSNSTILSKPGFSSSNAASFHLRRNNAVHYESPVFSGFQFQYDYGPDETKTVNKNNTLHSYGVKWEAGPLYLALAQEVHFDFFGGGSGNPTLQNSPNGAIHSKDNAIRATLGYKIGEMAIGADIAHLEYHDYGALAANKFERYKYDTWAFGVSQRFGNIRAALSTGRASKGTCQISGGATCDTMGLDGKVINLGAAYEFTKRIQMHVLYSKLTNGTSAIYNNLNNGDVTAGADIEQLALGVSIRM